MRTIQSRRDSRCSASWNAPAGGSRTRSAEKPRQHRIEARPPAPQWLLERGLSADNAVYVHAGDCWNAGKRSRGVTREQGCVRSSTA
ncbi:DUF6233 domain-containing protein [Streptomyces sp. NPDC005263]|uniref:DUF6233 domain-containing protein n=1 Tax=Streptomyces sp. NPDC005263 TaxID=3364711 RepID=UPI003681DBE2